VEALTPTQWGLFAPANLIETQVLVPRACLLVVVFLFFSCCFVVVCGCHNRGGPWLHEPVCCATDTAPLSSHVSLLGDLRHSVESVHDLELSEETLARLGLEVEEIANRGL